MNFDNYEEVFRPGAPLEMPQFFFGREQELIDFTRALRRPGHHPIVIGHRGVGKTSLVLQALDKLAGVSIIRITCDRVANFEDLGRSLLEQLGLDTTASEQTDETQKTIEGKGTLLGSGVAASGSEKHSIKRTGLASRRLTPWSLFQNLKNIKKKLVVVLDEYDSIQSSAKELHGALASLIKILADNQRDCDSRLVVVGVAQSAEDLLGKHESIERSAREIYLRPLRFEDIDNFLSEAETQLHFKFHQSVREAIIRNSLGYPYYVHLVGLECIDAMLGRDTNSRTVVEEDYLKAVRSAIQKAFRTTLRKYRTAVWGLEPQDKTFIRELVAAVTKDGGRIVPRQALQRQLESRNLMTSQQFNDTLIRLQQDKRLVFVSKNRDDVRFVEPLMAPFLRSAIFPDIGRGGSVTQPSLFDEDED